MKTIQLLRLISIINSLLIIPACSAQNPSESLLEDVLEDLSVNNGTDNSVNTPNWENELEELSNRMQEPVNLNVATREQLEQFPLSGKSRALLPPSPLRTVHESFPSYGSSNSIFLFVVRNRLILSTFSFISLVAVVVDKLPYNRTTNRYFVDVPCFCTIYFLAT